MTTPPRLAPLLAQFDYAWERRAQRLEGLTDGGYFWEPVPGCWNVRPRADCRTSDWAGGGEWVQEFELPDPEPAPFTTIAWRVTHLAAWITIRADYTIGTKAMHQNTYDVPGSAEAGRAALATAGEQWRAVLTSADDAALDQIGRSSNPWGLDPTLPFLDIAWQVNQEALRHGGEIALLRDLYRAWPCQPNCLCRSRRLASATRLRLSDAVIQRASEMGDSHGAVASVPCDNARHRIGGRYA